MEAHIVYRLTGYPLRKEEADLPPREIDVSHVPLYVLQRVFHAGPGNQMLERRHVTHEKAYRLQSYCAEPIDTAAYRWEFVGRWSDDQN